jgi:hypothetical protein
MKKMISSVVLLFFVIVLPAQIVIDGQDINELDGVQYLQVVAYNKPFTQKVLITINYGQEVTKAKENTIMVDGKAIVFNNVMDALNFFYARGWKYMDALAVTVQKSKYISLLSSAKRRGVAKPCIYFDPRYLSNLLAYNYLKSWKVCQKSVSSRLEIVVSHDLKC